MIVRVENLRKTYLGHVQALDGVCFQVDEGEVFGLLGPNGAGKTTTLKILLTLTVPDSGTAEVCGISVRDEPSRVRASAGYVSQEVTADKLLTGRENLWVLGRLYHVDRRTLRQRIDELLELFELRERADDLVGHYSGGMRKRIDIASGLLHRPRLLVLDEPTLGLDIQTRHRIWDYIRMLREQGMGILLTTHYLEEADQLCDRVAIIDCGKICASGTPAKLKEEIGGDAVSLRLDGALREWPRELVARIEQLPFVRRTVPQDNALEVYIIPQDSALPELLRLVESQGYRVETMIYARPSLDDVFLKYAGRKMREV